MRPCARHILCNGTAAVPPPPCAFCGAPHTQTPRTEHSARLMVDGLRAGALAVGPDGHICDANRGAAQILRIPLEELRRAWLQDVLAPLDHLKPLLAKDPGDRVELSLRLRDGHEATVGCSLSEVHDGNRLGFVVLFQDISSVVELRTQRDRLLQLAAVADSLPSVLHEIRNPLASVTSVIEVLSEEVTGRHHADICSVLDELKRIGLCLQGIGGLHSDLRTKSPEAVDQAIREACRIMRSTGEVRGVQVHCEVPSMPPLPVRGAVVRGLVFNLMRNAIDACASSGHVRLAAGFDQATGRLTLSVRDNGRGMTADEAKRCCDIFFTTKEHGSGVGLPICKQVIERAGGELRVASKLGEGTEVRVEVPVVAPS